jgi:hypothetical protein
LHFAFCILPNPPPLTLRQPYLLTPNP